MVPPSTFHCYNDCEFVLFLISFSFCAVDYCSAPFWFGQDFIVPRQSHRHAVGDAATLLSNTLHRLTLFFIFLLLLSSFVLKLFFPFFMLVRIVFEPHESYLPTQYLSLPFFSFLFFFAYLLTSILDFRLTPYPRCLPQIPI